MTQWRRLKSGFYALLITALAAFAIHQQADPTVVFTAAAVVILAITTVEVKEVQIAQFATVTFFRNKTEDDDS